LGGGSVQHGLSDAGQLSCHRQTSLRRPINAIRKAKFKNPNNLPETCRRHIKVHRYAAIAKSVTIENDHHHRHNHHHCCVIVLTDVMVRWCTKFLYGCMVSTDALLILVTFHGGRLRQRSETPTWIGSIWTAGDVAG
jgi:hypothetical protein